jgi:hypothetical protein
VPEHRGRRLEEDLRKARAMAETPDYKSTMNLPQTEFPMRANLALREVGRSGSGSGTASTSTVVRSR